MATLTASVTDASGYKVTCTITYTVTSAAGATTISYQSKTYTDAAPIRLATDKLTFSLVIDGTTIKSGDIDGAATGTGSKSIVATHAAQSKVLKLGVVVKTSGGTKSASKTASVTVPARTSYTVTYNANGGGSAPSNQTKWYGEALTLRSAVPTRSGYVFHRWNTNTSNTGTAYSPGASYTANAALSLYAIWNPIISYNTNGGSGTFAPQTKTYGMALTLSSAVPTRTGYTFLGWATSSSATTAIYQPGSSYTSNTAVTLYAVWRKDAVAPTISDISVVRSDSSGDPDDEGTYCKVTATWSVDRTGAGMSSNTGVVTGQIAAQGGTTRAITWQSGASGTSDTAVALVPDCDTDTQYVVLVIVTNTIKGTGQSTYLSTQRADILTRSYFILDFADGGRGVGIGCAAPDDGLAIAFDTQFNGELKHVDDVPWASLELSGSVNAYSVQQAPKYMREGKTVHLQGAVSPKNQVASGGTLAIGTLPVGCRPTMQTVVVCQGSDQNIWDLDISQNGLIQAQGYRAGATNHVIDTTTLLTFSACFGTE